MELEALANAIKGKEIKCLHIKEEDIKLFFPTDDMIIYAENPTSSAKAIKLICDFIKAALHNNLFLKIHYFCVCSVAKSYQTL